MQSALRQSRALRLSAQSPLLLARTTPLRAAFGTSRVARADNDQPIGRRFRPDNPYKDPSSFKEYFKLYYDPAGFPIIALCVVAVIGAAWYVARLARGSEIVWDKKNNPEPWNKVGPKDQLKMMNYGGDFDKKYSRKEL